MQPLSLNSMTKTINDFKTRFINLSPRMSACIPVCLSLICTLLLPSYLSDKSIVFSNSFVSIAYAAVMFLLFRWYWKQEHKKRELVLTHIFGFILSCMTAMGRAMDQTGRFFPIGLMLCFSIMLYTHVFACGVSLLWVKLSEIETKEWTVGKSKSDACSSRLHKCVSFAMSHPWVIGLILALCWLPCYIALFPGGFSYDMMNEFNQQFMIYKSDFPRLHSVLIIGCLNAAHSLFGSYNAGIAIYAAIQMIAFSAMFAHMLVTFYRQRLNGVLICLFGAYFALFPIIPLIVTHTGRDTLFAGLLTYLGFLLYQLACDTKGFLSSMRKPAILGTVLSLTLMSRNNNSELIMLALLAVLNFIVWFRLHRTYSRVILAFSVTNVAVFIILSLALSATCKPISGVNPRASMSLVSQTLIRAYIEEPEKWTDKDAADFQYYMNMDSFRYCPECADYSKNMLRNVKGAKNSVGFVKMWLRMGFKCPGSYMNAVIAQTRYMWYPDALIDGYVRAEIYSPEKCYFVTGVEKPGVRVPLWPEGEEFYRIICRDISFEKIPILSMLFSIGFQYWLLLNCLFYSVYRRRKKWFLPLGVIFVYLVFCFFIPLVLMRYFMPLFLFFPVTMVMTVNHQMPSCESVDIN